MLPACCLHPCCGPQPRHSLGARRPPPFPQPAAHGAGALGFPRWTPAPRAGQAPPCLQGRAPMWGGNSFVRINRGSADGEVRLGWGEDVGWVLLGGFPLRWCPAEGCCWPAPCHHQPHLRPLTGQSASEAETALLPLLHQGFPFTPPWCCLTSPY